MNAERGRATLLTLVSIAAVVGITFRDLLSADQIPIFRDLLVFVIPFKNFLGEHLRRLEIPLWNPWLFMGSPFLASLQTGVCYPPSLLLALPFPLGFNLFLLVHYAIALSGIWMLLRSRGLSLAPTAIGSLTFVIGGYLVSVMNLTSHLQSAAWAPWVLFCWDCYRRRRTRTDLIVFALALAIQFLGGAPEIFLMTLAVVFGFTIFGASRPAIEVPRLMAALAVAAVATGGLVAFQLLPTLEFLRHSAREGGLSYDALATWSLEPVSLLQLVFPHSSNPALAGEAHMLRPGFETHLPWIESLYLGLVPLCLLIAGLGSRHDRSFWALLTAVGVVLSLGTYTPIFPLFHAMVPGSLQAFRFPQKFLFLAHLGATVLAAEGAERVVRRQEGVRAVARTAAATLVVVAASLLVARWVRPAEYLWLVAMLKGSPLSADQLLSLAVDLSAKCERLLLILGTFLAILWLDRRAIVGRAAFAVLLVALVAADLSAAHHQLNWSISWAKLSRHPLLIDPAELRSSGGYVFHYQTTSAPSLESAPEPIPGLEWWLSRIETPNLEENAIRLWRSAYMNLGMLHHIRNLSGIEGIPPSWDVLLGSVLARVPRDDALALLRLYGVSVLIGPDPLRSDSLERLEPTHPSLHYAYRLLRPAPRAYLATRVLPATSDREAFDLMRRPEFLPGETAVVHDPPADSLYAADGSAAGQARVTSEETERVLIQVRAVRPALLVLNDSHFPGWEARVDGTPAKIHRTNVFVRGVAVPPGSHLVEFAYRPISFRLGLATSAFSLIIIAIAAGLHRVRPRPFDRT